MQKAVISLKMMSKSRSSIDRKKIPKHLRHLSDKVVKALFYLFRGKF